MILPFTLRFPWVLGAVLGEWFYVERVRMMGVGRMGNLAFVLLLTGVLCACEGGSGSGREVRRLELRVEELEGRLWVLDSGFQDVVLALDQLGVEIEDFRSENWKTNVPDVEYEFEELRRVVFELEKRF